MNDPVITGQLPEAVVGGPITVADLLAAYLTFAKTYYSRDGEPTSEYTSMKEAMRPLRRLYGHTPVVLRQTMSDDDLCRRHINRVRRIFKWGVENEIVPAGMLHALQAVAPLRKGRTTARESEPVKPVPDQHVDAVLSLVSRQVAAMIQLQRLAGMRPGKVVMVRPCDVDRTGDVWVYVPARHKTDYHGHQRIIFLEAFPQGGL